MLKFLNRKRKSVTASVPTPVSTNAVHRPVVQKVVFQAPKKLAVPHILSSTPTTGQTWVDKFAKHPHIGDTVQCDMLRQGIIRKHRLPVSKPTALMVRGPDGCGKSSLVQQLAEQHSWQVFWFGPDSLVAEWETRFLPALMCKGFQPRVVVIDRIAQCQVPKLLKLLARLHGTAKKLPQVANPLVLIGTDEYHRTFTQLNKYCGNITLSMNRALMQKIVTRAAIEEGIILSPAAKMELVTQAKGNPSKMLTQMEFYGKDVSFHHDCSQGSSFVKEIHTARWSKVPVSEDFYRKCLDKSRYTFMTALCTNAADNQTTMDDVSALCDTMSSCEGLFNDMLAPTIQYAMAVMPKGRPPKKLNFPTKQSWKTEKFLFTTAIPLRLTLPELRERLNWTTEYSWTVFDEKYAQEHEVGLPVLRQLNKKVRAYVAFCS